MCLSIRKQKTNEVSPSKTETIFRKQKQVMRTIFIFFTLVCVVFQLQAGSAKTQEIKGRIIDKNTGAPLQGVTISISEAEVSIGTITDENGEFSLWDVPVNTRLRVSLDGYKDVYLDSVSINDSILIVEMECNTKWKKKLSLGNLLKNNKAESPGLDVFASE